MDDDFAALVLSDFPCTFNGLMLRPVNRGVSTVTFANYCPTVRSFHYVLINLHKMFHLFLPAPATRRRKHFCIYQGQLTLGSETSAVPVKKNLKINHGIATRPQVERMHAIVRRIQKGDYPSRLVLAAELGWTTRTIQRDITFMQNREEMPIAYDFCRHGYYLTEKLADFPLLQISEGEIVSLFVAQRAMAQYRGTPFEQPLRIACEKLMEGLKGQFSVAWGDLDAAISFRNIETTSVDIRVFKDLSFAVQNNREVTFDYCKLGATGFERRNVRPYHLTCINYQWYVLGHDLLRKEIRRFVLGRMQSLRVLEKEFSRPRNFSAAKCLKGSFGVFSGDKPIEIRIWFSPFAARLVRERQWHHSQEIKHLANGEIELKLTLTSIVEIARWILSWGEHAEALAPAELVQSVTKTIQASLHRYGVTRPDCLKRTPSIRRLD